MPEENKHSLVWYHESEKAWIGTDLASGGYPFDTSLNEAKYFDSVESANEYKSHWPDEDWSLHEIYTRVSRY